MTRTTRFRTTTLAAALSLAIPAIALAAEAGSAATDLDAIDVHGVRVQGYAAPVTNVGLKLPASQRETPQSVSVLTRPLLDDLALDSLDDAVLFVPGVALRQYDSIDTQYIARGFEITNFQLDGLPATLGRAKPRLAMYDRVEVLRGAAGLLNGAGDPGGVINLVRKRPGPELAGEATLAAGSWNSYRVLGDVGGPLAGDGHVRARGVVEHEDRDKFYDPGDHRYSLGYGILETDVAADGTLSLGASYEKLQTTPNWSGLPRYSDGRALDLPRDATLEPAWQDITTEGRQFFAEYNQDLGANWRLRVSAQYARENGRYLVANGWGEIDPDTGAGWSITPTLQYRTYTNQSLDAALSGQFSAWGRQHDVLFGWNWNTSGTDASGDDFLESYEVADVHAFDPWALAAPGTLSGEWYWAGHYTTTQDGVYAMLRLRPAERLTTLLGLRYSRLDNYDRERVPVAYVSTDYGDRHLGGYAGLVYDVSTHWSLYASYADIFQPQGERSTEGRLDPKEGRGLEAGLKGEWFDGALNASFALFDVRQEGLAQEDATQPPDACNGGNCYLAQDVKSHGFEATVAGRVFEGFDVSAGYTWNEQEYARLENQGEPFNTWAPKQILRVWTSWRPAVAPDWSFGLGGNWQSATGASDGSEQPAYALWFARVGYRFDERWNLALNVDNLFDQDYWQTVGPTSWGNFRGAPRSFTATLRYRF